jgi:hypothetical protein
MPSGACGWLQFLVSGNTSERHSLTHDDATVSVCAALRGLCTYTCMQGLWEEFAQPSVLSSPYRHTSWKSRRNRRSAPLRQEISLLVRQGLGPNTENSMNLEAVVLRWWIAKLLINLWSGGPPIVGWLRLFIRYLLAATFLCLEALYSARNQGTLRAVATRDPLNVNTIGCAVSELPFHFTSARLSAENEV